MESTLTALMDRLRDALLLDLRWLCQRGQGNQTDDHAWLETRVLMGREWETARFRTSFTVPSLLGGSSLKVFPILGGTSEILINGKRIGACDSTGWVESPVLAAGEEVSLEVVNARGWMSYENPAPARLASCREERLRRIFEQLFFAHGMWKADPERAEIGSAMKAFLAEVQGLADPDGDVDAYLVSLESAERHLSPISAILKEYQIYILPHSHVDLAWGWTYEETKRIMRTVFDRATSLMDRHKDYTFVQDQPPAFDHLEGTALMEKVAKCVSEGRLEPCGAMYSEPEGNMPSGESFIRQIMLAKRYFRSRFGFDPVTSWNLDSFSGHCWSLPQILLKSGVKYYTFANWANLIPDVEFWWKGPDGSRVLAYHLPCHYDSAQMMEHGKILRNFFGYKSRSRYKRFMFLDGDDLTPPLEVSVDGVRWFEGLAVSPPVKFSTSAEFFSDLEAEGLNGLPVFAGELVQYLDSKGTNNVGSYTTHGEVKRRNRLCENLLISAEKLGSIAMLLGFDYPRAAMSRAWRRVLLNQMHDILPGTAIKEAYDEAHRAYDEAEAIAGEVTASSMGRISSRIDTGGQGIPIVVFNTLSWERTDVAHFQLTLEHSYDAWPRMRGPDGEDVACQVIRDTRGTYDKTNRNLELVFVAEGVPSMGYKVYHLTLDGSPPAGSLLREENGEIVLENRSLSARIDPKTGLLTSLTSEGREHLSEERGLLIQRYRDDGDPWHTKLDDHPIDLDTTESVEVVESGPVRATVRVRRRLGETQISQEVSASAGVPRLVCRTTIDCRETNVLFKLCVPVEASEPEATFEIPFAAITRPMAELDCAAQNWADISGPEQGLALLNAGRYGYDAPSGGLRVSLLRNPRGHKSAEGTDTGVHAISCAVYPHGGDWRSGVVRQGLEFNNPLLCHVDSLHGGDLPSALSFLSVNAGSAIVSCLKPHEDSDDLVLRLYEPHGEESPVVGIKSGFTWGEAREIDMVERDSPEGGAEPNRPMSPYEVRTLRLESPAITRPG